MHLLQGPWTIEASNIPGIRPLANLLRVKFNAQIDEPGLQQMFKACGPHTVFADNLAVVMDRLELQGEIPSSTVLKLFRKTGLLDAQPLRSVHGPVRLRPRVTVLICGATVSQMRLRIEEALLKQRKGSIRIDRFVGLASSERVCNSSDELWDTSLRAIKSRQGHLPTEARMLQALFDDLPVHFRQVVRSSTELQLEPQLMAFARSYPANRIYVPTTAATQSVALMARRVLRYVWGDWFDRRDAPGLFTSNAARPLAIFPEQCETPLKYVHPLAFPSGVVRFAWELFLAGAAQPA